MGGAKSVVCVDLDGVLNLFDEWKAPEYFHPPRPGAREFLAKLQAAGYHVCILTCRWHEWVEKWLEENGLRCYVDQVTNHKIPADVYVDDRAVCFRGNFETAYEQVVSFRTHWERQP